MAKLTSKAARIRTHVRVRRKVKGTTERPRLAVNFSGHHIRAQVIDDVTGKTLVSAFTTGDGGNHSGDFGSRLDHRVKDHGFFGKFLFNDRIGLGGHRRDN